MARRFVQHRVFVISEAEGQGVHQYGTGDSRHLKQAQQSPKVALGLRRSNRFGGEIVNRGNRRGTEQAVDILGGHVMEQRRGATRMWSASQQDVQHDICVEENTHRFV